MKKFRHLNVPSRWEHYWSKYPEGYTILEALLNWVDDVDKLTDNVNDWNERLDEFIKTFDKNIQHTVRDTLREWQEDGTIDHIINDTIFEWKADKVDVGDIKDLTTDENENIVSAVNGVDDDVKDISYVAPLNTFSNIADGINELYQSLPVGSWLKIPAGEHFHDKPLILDREINVDFKGSTMNYNGDRTLPAIQIGKESDWTRRINIRGLISRRATSGLYEIRDVGIRITNLAYSDVEFSAYNYHDGVVLDSGNAAGNVYNKYNPVWLYNNKRSIVITTFNSTGWTNENNFYGGGFSFTSDVGTPEHCHVTIERKHGYRNNNNRFYGPSFEDAADKAYAINSEGSSIYFYGARFEYINRVKMGTNALDNVIMHGFGADNITVEGTQSALSIFGSRKVDLSLDSRGFKIRSQTSTGNAFEVERSGNTLYSVSNEGDVSMRNLDLLNRINFMNNRGIGLSSNVSNTPYGPGSLFINNTGGYGGFKFKTYGAAEDTENGWKDVQLVHSSTTTAAPKNISPGFMVFNTTINKPTWWTGTTWVDATGAEV